MFVTVKAHTAPASYTSRALPAGRPAGTLTRVRRRVRIFLGIAACLLLAGVAILSLSMRYYFRELDALVRATCYPSPDAALRTVAAPRYPDACRIEFTIEPSDIVRDVRLGSV